MRRLVAFVVAWIALLGLLRPAHACENATVRESPAVKQLHRAEEALDLGDVAEARRLAAEVAAGKVYLPFSMREDLKLRVDLASRDVPDAARQADLGEAYARAGQDDAAYQMLRSLHEKDLIGSPYAYAALARVSAKRGDQARADAALKRCAEISSSPAICRGAYPKPPLLRGNVFGYVLPGVLALVALVRRRRARSKPWATFGDKVFAAIVVATCAFVFAFAYEPWLTTLATFASLIFVGLTQRLAFVAAVKRGRVSGWTLREASAEDERLPVVASFFHVGHRVLEREPDASYRDPARVPVLRVSPRSAAARGLAIAAVVGVALLGACSTLTFSVTRGAASEAGEMR